MTNDMAFFPIVSRWLHLISACLAVGGVLFIRFVLPGGLKLLPETQHQPVLLAVRRRFKRIVHAAIFLLLLTGIYNTSLAWDKYQLDKALLHALWGTHVFLAACAFTISLYVLAGPRPPRSHRKLMALNFAILLLVVAAASTLKWARERAVAEHPATVAPLPPTIAEHPPTVPVSDKQ
ncbi:MAG: hypothetical protein ABSC42_04190 [Tepidisphaeraceae bacterium]